MAKIPRNLHVVLILGLGVVMVLGFLFKSLNDEKQNKPAPSVTEKEAAPDPGSLLSEIKRQNDAALRAKEELLRKERELAQAKIVKRGSRHGLSNHQQLAISRIVWVVSAQQRLCMHSSSRHTAWKSSTL